MIVLFANLEVLFCLNIAYLKQTDNENDIRKYARDTKIIKKLLNKYCLTENNTWYKRNKNRSRKITSTKIKELRNALTHFFSLSHGISVIPEISKEKVEKLEKLLEKNGQKDTTFMSPDDLYEIIKGVVMLMLKE